jgi:hypothetical protein
MWDSAEEVTSVRHGQNPSDGWGRYAVPDFRSALEPGGFTHSRKPLARFSAARYRSRPRKLTTEEVTTVRALAATKSLRSLAADFGVSHETIRATLGKD